MAAAIRRLNIRCGLESADGVLYVRHTDEVRALRREAESRRAAGIDATAQLTRRTASGPRSAAPLGISPPAPRLHVPSLSRLKPLLVIAPLQSTPALLVSLSATIVFCSVIKPVLEL